VLIWAAIFPNLLNNPYLYLYCSIYGKKVNFSAETADRQAVIQPVEHVSIQRARDILGKGGLSDLIDFI